MAEYIDAFNRSGTYLKTGLKEVILREIRQKSLQEGDAPFQVKVIHVLLYDSEGNIIISQRSPYEKENPGYLDKTVGGHVSAGQDFNEALRRECYEEQGISPIVIVSAEEFPEALRYYDTCRQAVIRGVQRKSWKQSRRVNSQKKSWIKRVDAMGYLGCYDGQFRPVDKECLKTVKIKKKKLQEELRAYPDKFTDDLREMIRDYWCLL